MSKLENDCISVLNYSRDNWPRWISITELIDKLGIPPSTLRNMFLVSDRGYYTKIWDDGECTVFSDVLRKIAQKHRYEYKIRKMKNEDGRMTWHISATKMPYFE
jgi:hypothetical protein